MSYTMLKTSEPQDRAFLMIVLVVIGLHGILIGWAALTNSFITPPSMPTPRKLVVQTIALSPPSITVTEEVAEVPPPLAQEVIEVKEALPEPAIPEPEPSPTAVVEKSPPLAPAVEPVKPQEVKPEPKKEEKRAEPVKKPAPKKKPPAPKKPAKTPPKPKPQEKVNSPKKETPKVPPKKADPKPNKEKVDAEKAAAEKKAVEKREVDKLAAEKLRKKEAEQQVLKARQQQLLTQAQERIAKIGQSRDKVSAGRLADLAITPVPTAITSLHIDALPSSQAQPLSDHEISYRDELAGRLKLLLKLPEFGEVKIKLTLDRSGKVAKVVVVSAESAANRKHIEKTLPSLTFPAFGNNFGDAGQYTFAITLSNEL